MKPETTNVIDLIAGFAPLIVADCASDFPGKSALVSIYSKPTNMILAEKVPRALACIFVKSFNESHNVHE
jgi:hypothetical protein